MIDDRWKRHQLRQRMASRWTVPTTMPSHLSLQPIEPEPWTRPAPARPIPVSRPWWRRAADFFLDFFR